MKPTLNDRILCACVGFIGLAMALMYIWGRVHFQ